MSERMCDRKGCSELAKWKVNLLLRPRDSEAKIKAGTGIVVCDEHREKLPDAFITDEGWKAVLADFDQKGWKRPHRIRTLVGYEPLFGDGSTIMNPENVQ